MASRQRSADARVHLSLLDQCPFFRGVTPRRLATFLRWARVKQVKAGDVLFKQGDPPAGVYLLVEGAGKLVRSGHKGRQIVLEFLRPGDLFGFIAILGHTEQMTTAHMVADGRVLLWNPGVMTRMIRSHSILTANALRCTAIKLQADCLRLEDLATEPVEQRVARALLRLAGTHTGALALPHQDVAEFVGTTPQTLSRILRRWKGRGLVKTSRAHISIQEPVKLTSIADDP
jgi:CRP/FNR family transcriptional regulator, nitrogen oxide reductase regulator